MKRDNAVVLTMYEKYCKYGRYIENIIFPLLLIVYPLMKVNQGIDVSDTTYSLGNFQYFDSMEGTWMVATFLANAAGSLLMHLPFGGTLSGMNFYTALFQSATALMAYMVLKKRIPAPLVFTGEIMALGLCWCPSAILYNYLTYLLMTAGTLLLYCGLLARRRAAGKRTAGQETAKGTDGKRAVLLYIAAGVCLGANVAVRMPNVVQAAFIVVVWYGAALQRRDGEQRPWRRAVTDTLWCMLGYAVGFGIPFAAICAKYGVRAYPSMVQTMFAMTEKAADYKPASMITGMFGDYFTGLYWLAFAGVCIAAGWFAMKIQEKFLAEHKAARILCRLGYLALLFVLLRFYWGRGMFSFRYYEYSSMYYPTVLLLLITIAAAVACLVQQEAFAERKLLAAVVLVQIFVTPLGSNNKLYPIINSLFLAIPFVLWEGASRWKRGSLRSAKQQPAKQQPEKRQQAKVQSPKQQPGRQEAGFVWKAPFVLLCLFVLVQSIGFHVRFVFQDGVQGERRTMCVTAPSKAANVYTGQDNGELLQELALYAQEEELAGREAILYGEIPGLGYLLDMPPALSTFWPDLDSYRMAEYERDMGQVEAKLRQGGEAPVIILASSAAAYLSEDADAMNWFGVDREAMAADEKLGMLGGFMQEYGYEETFCNARYAVYMTEQ